MLTGQICSVSMRHHQLSALFQFQSFQSTIFDRMHTVFVFMVLFGWHNLRIYFYDVENSTTYAFEALRCFMTKIFEKKVWVGFKTFVHSVILFCSLLLKSSLTSFVNVTELRFLNDPSVSSMVWHTSLFSTVSSFASVFSQFQLGVFEVLESAYRLFMMKFVIRTHFWYAYSPLQPNHFSCSVIKSQFYEIRYFNSPKIFHAFNKFSVL